MEKHGVLHGVPKPYINNLTCLLLTRMALRLTELGTDKLLIGVAVEADVEEDEVSN